MKWSGTVTTGVGNCSTVKPFPAGWFQGSLNLVPDIDGELHGRITDRRPLSWQHVQWMPIIFPAVLMPWELNCLVGLDPYTRLHEVATTVHLRTTFGLSDGDVVTLEIDDRLVSNGSEMG
jgi:hypothetical protein